MNLKKIISSVVITAFTVTAMQSYTYAVSANILPLPQNILSPEYGIVTDRFNTDSKYKVYCIQDMHCNAQGQNQIYEILKSLKQRHGEDLQLIGVEGASGMLDAGILQNIPRDDIKTRVVDKLFTDGIITGAEKYIAWDNETMLYGVEDWDLYNENFNDIYKSVSFRKELDEILNNVRKGLRRGKEVVYHDKVLEIENLKQRYNNGNISFTEYVRNICHPEFISGSSKRDYLTKTLKQVQGDRIIGFDESNPYNNNKRPDSRVKPEDDKINVIPATHSVIPAKAGIQYNNDAHLQKYLEADRLSSHLNYNLIQSETVYLIKNLKNKLSKELQNSLEQTENSKEYYLLLKNILKTNKIQYEKHYPELARYMKYLEILDGIDISRLNEETEKFEYKLTGYFANGADEKDLVYYNRYLDLLEGYLKNELSVNETEEWLRGRERFYSLVDGIADKLSRRNYLKESLNKIKDIESTMTRFYELAEKRNEVMVKNLLSFNSQFSIPNSENSVAVLIVGGYHTEGITEILRAKGISYEVITPKVNSIEGRERYLKGILKQGKSGISFIGRVTPPLQNSSIAIASALMIGVLTEEVYRELALINNPAPELTKLSNIFSGMVSILENISRAVETRRELIGINTELLSVFGFGFDVFNSFYVPYREMLDKINGIKDEFKELKDLELVIDFDLDHNRILMTKSDDRKTIRIGLGLLNDLRKFDGKFWGYFIRRNFEYLVDPNKDITRFKYNVLRDYKQLVKLRRKRENLKLEDIKERLENECFDLVLQSLYEPPILIFSSEISYSESSVIRELRSGNEIQDPATRQGISLLGTNNVKEELLKAYITSLIEKINKNIDNTDDNSEYLEYLEYIIYAINFNIKREQSIRILIELIITAKWDVRKLLLLIEIRREFISEALYDEIARLVIESLSSQDKGPRFLKEFQGIIFYAIENNIMIEAAIRLINGRSPENEVPSSVAGDPRPFLWGRFTYTFPSERSAAADRVRRISLALIGHEPSSEHEPFSEEVPIILSIPRHNTMLDEIDSISNILRLPFSSYHFGAARIFHQYLDNSHNSPALFGPARDEMIAERYKDDPEFLEKGQDVVSFLDMRKHYRKEPVIKRYKSDLSLFYKSMQSLVHERYGFKLSTYKLKVPDASLVRNDSSLLSRVGGRFYLKRKRADVIDSPSKRRRRTDGDDYRIYKQEETGDLLQSRRQLRLMQKLDELLNDRNQIAETYYIMYNHETLEDYKIRVENKSFEEAHNEAASEIKCFVDLLELFKDMNSLYESQDKSETERLVTNIQMRLVEIYGVMIEGKEIFQKLASYSKAVNYLKNIKNVMGVRKNIEKMKVLEKIWASADLIARFNDKDILDVLNDYPEVREAIAKMQVKQDVMCEETRMFAFDINNPLMQYFEKEIDKANNNDNKLIYSERIKVLSDGMVIYEVEYIDSDKMVSILRKPIGEKVEIGVFRKTSIEVTNKLKELKIDDMVGDKTAFVMLRDIISNISLRKSEVFDPKLLNNITMAV
ncbi:MAG: hypothetical protein ABH857_03870 [Elusimicrobiota bacterium]